MAPSSLRDVLSRRAAPLAAPLREATFRRLFAAQLTSLGGDWLSRLALAVLVWDHTRSEVTVALLTVLSLAPWAVFGPWLATAGDRWDRRRVLIGCDLIRAGAFAAMCLPVPMPALVALVVVAAMTGPAFEAARFAAVADSVPEDAAGAAFALSGIGQQIGIVGGNVAGAILVGLVGPRGALGINAASFLISAWLLRAVPSRLTERAARQLVRGAVRIVIGDSVLRPAAMTACTVGLFGVATEAVAVPVFDGNVTLAAAATVVTAAATVVTSTFVSSGAGAETLLRRGALLAAAGAAVGSAAALPAPLVTFAAVGVMFAGMVPLQAAVAVRLPADVRSSVFGVLQTSLFAAQAGGAAIGGASAQVFGARPAVVGVLGVGALAGLASARPRRHADPGPDLDGPRDAD